MKCPWQVYKTIRKNGMGNTSVEIEWDDCYEDKCPFFREFTTEVTNIEYCMRAKFYDPAKPI